MITMDNIGIENTGKMFNIAFKFPIDSFINLFVSDFDRKKIKILDLKEDVLDYIRIKKRVNISEVMDKFNLSLDEAGLILKELSEEKQINLRN